jgi:hypothetical protein
MACWKKPVPEGVPSATRVQNSESLKSCYASVKKGAGPPDRATMGLLWDQTDSNKVQLSPSSPHCHTQ